MHAETSDQCSPKSKPWWLDEKIKLKICQIYRAKGMLEEFVNAIFAPVRESLNCCETHKQKVMTWKLSMILDSIKLYEFIDWILTISYQTRAT